jgi:NAD(P)-dependent dehydrogenase (short-subunit alcohol dehydrogenase family)
MPRADVEATSTAFDLGASLFDLRGKIALVTGSTRGIGLGIVKRFAQHGAKVVVSSRKADAVERARAEVVEAGGDAFGFPCNVGDKAQLQALVDATVERFGGLDILVVNAAVNPYFGPLSGIGDDAFDKIMGSNVRSSLWLCNMALPHIAARGGGSVILLSSIAGLRGSRLLGAYAISKAADMQLARNLAIEWGPKNVRINTLAPGIIRTDFAKALYENPAIYKQAVGQYPLGRLGEVDDVSGAAVFLASPAGAFVTGQTITIDGGTTTGGFD